MHYEVEFFSQEKKCRNLTINYCVSNCECKIMLNFSPKKKKWRIWTIIYCVSNAFFSFHSRKDDIFTLSTTQSDFSVNIWCTIIKKS